MDKVTTKEALEILHGRGIEVPYPTLALWVRDGRFAGAESVDTPRGPVWYIPRESVENFTPPTRGRRPKAKAEQSADKSKAGKASGPHGRVVVTKKGGKN